MPTTIPVDDELDPIELADQEDEETTDDGLPVAVIGDDTQASTDPDASIVEEINKIGVEEEPKQRAHMIPRHLIDAPLTMDDLFDDGTI